MGTAVVREGQGRHSGFEGSVPGCFARLLQLAPPHAQPFATLRTAPAGHASISCRDPAMRPAQHSQCCRLPTLGAGMALLHLVHALLAEGLATWIIPRRRALFVAHREAIITMLQAHHAWTLIYTSECCVGSGEWGWGVAPRQHCTAHARQSRDKHATAHRTALEGPFSCLKFVAAPRPRQQRSTVRAACLTGTRAAASGSCWRRWRVRLGREVAAAPAALPCWPHNSSQPSAGWHRLQLKHGADQQAGSWPGHAQSWLPAGCCSTHRRALCLACSRGPCVCATSCAGALPCLLAPQARRSSWQSTPSMRACC